MRLISASVILLFLLLHLFFFIAAQADDGEEEHSPETMRATDFKVYSKKLASPLTPSKLEHQEASVIHSSRNVLIPLAFSVTTETGALALEHCGKSVPVPLRPQSDAAGATAKLAAKLLYLPATAAPAAPEATMWGEEGQGGVPPLPALQADCGGSFVPLTAVRDEATPPQQGPAGGLPLAAAGECGGGGPSALHLLPGSGGGGDGGGGAEPLGAVAVLYPAGAPTLRARLLRRDLVAGRDAVAELEVWFEGGGGGGGSGAAAPPSAAATFEAKVAAPRGGAGGDVAAAATWQGAASAAAVAAAAGEGGRARLRVPLGGEGGGGGGGGAAAGTGRRELWVTGALGGGEVLRTLPLVINVLENVECLPRLDMNAGSLPRLAPATADEGGEPGYWEILLPAVLPDPSPPRCPSSDGAAAAAAAACPPGGDAVHVSAELWTDRGVAIAALSTVAPLECAGGEAEGAGGAGAGGRGRCYLRLAFHEAWLARLGARPAPGALRLRRVGLRDRHTHILYDEGGGGGAGGEGLPLAFEAGPTEAAFAAVGRRLAAPWPGGGAEDLRRAVLHGPRPRAFRRPPPAAAAAAAAAAVAPGKEEEGAAAAAGYRAFLAHGYCSAGAPFPAADFPYAAYLHYTAGYDEALSVDALARELLAFADEYGADSYSMVGHSQGGMAALHLYTYYWSGLDRVTPEAGQARIQAVSSPFRGTPLMNYWVLDDLVALAGFFCGYVDDMNPDTAAAWLALIPEDRQSEVLSYRMWNGRGELPCVFAAELIFTDQDDGATEVGRNVVIGEGNNIDPEVPWCHTTGMNHAPGYNNHAQNEKIALRIAVA